MCTPAPAVSRAGGRVPLADVSTSDQPRLLRAYLADHLQLLRSARELAARVRRRERGAAGVALLDDVLAELSRNEAVAIAFLRQLGAGPPGLRLALGTAAERVGRLKPNGRLFRPSPLALVFEVEVLESLLEMSARCWRAVDRAGVAAPEVVAARADALEGLVPRLEAWRLQAAADALGVGEPT